MSNRIVYANTAGFAPTATKVEYAATASFIGLLTIEQLELVGGGTTGSIITNTLDDIFGQRTIDTFPVNKGNSARWLVFISDGINSKTLKVVATWDNTFVNFYSSETQHTGDVPVDFSMSNSGTDVSLIATPNGGNWKVKFTRTII